MKISEQKSIDKLNKIIKCSRIKWGQTTHTHVLVQSPGGKFDFSGNVKEFWDAYMECVRHKIPLHIAENPGFPELPILVDIDLKKLAGEQLEPLYNSENVEKVISAYQETLKNTLFELPEDALTCVLLEKAPREIEAKGVRYTKHGFHLHFPKIFVDVTTIQTIIIPSVKEKLKGLFDHLLALEDREKHYEFIDGSASKNHWLLYGSSKQYYDPYIATWCYEDGATRVKLDVLKNYEIAVQSGEERQEEYDVLYYLPRILSIFVADRAKYYYRLKPELTPSVHAKEVANQKKRIAFENRKRMECTDESLEKILTDVRSLLGLMSDERPDNYHNWISIGFAIWMIANGSDEGLSVWLEFSERSPKFDESECSQLWSRMRPTNYTIGTLKYFAKSDNPEKYDKLYSRRSSTLATPHTTTPVQFSVVRRVHQKKPPVFARR